MGTSTDAILAFGVKLGVGDVVQDAIMRKLYDAMPPEAQTIPADKNDYDWLYEDTVMQHYGLGITRYCSDAYVMHLLTIKEIRSYRGDTKVVTLDDLVVDPERCERLEDAARILNIADAPKWYLVSWWSN